MSSSFLSSVGNAQSVVSWEMMTQGAQARGRGLDVRSTRRSWEVNARHSPSPGFRSTLLAALEKHARPTVCSAVRYQRCCELPRTLVGRLDLAPWESSLQRGIDVDITLVLGHPHIAIGIDSHRMRGC